MEQLQDSSILESNVKKETYLLRIRSSFKNNKHFFVVKKYKEEESELGKKILSLLKRFGVKVEGTK